MTNRKLKIVCKHRIYADESEIVNQAILDGNAYAKALISVTLGGEQTNVDCFDNEYTENDIDAVIEAEYVDGKVIITLIEDKFDYSDSDQETGCQYSFDSSDGEVIITDILRVEK